VAFQTDSTRIATLMMGREGSLRSYDEIGVPESHHPDHSMILYGAGLADGIRTSTIIYPPCWWAARAALFGRAVSFRWLPRRRSRTFMFRCLRAPWR
jgi:hypothetical protein